MGRNNFRRLRVWRKAHENALEVYKLTTGFPGDERFGLTSQMRRAAVSVPANITEGWGRRKPLDKMRVYNEGSNEELKNFVVLAQDLGYAKDGERLWLSIEEGSRRMRKPIKTISLDA